MSRCFSYPPPGYYRNGASHDALIESIKLQKETNKTKAEKDPSKTKAEKETNKSKADRKKEKKAKKEKKEKKQKGQKNTVDDFYKATKTITDVYEKSDLTQEHGQPIQPSYSSDSTQNSNKRKRDQYSLLPADNNTNNGSFKIRLLKKQKGSGSNNIVSDVRSTVCFSIPSSSNANRNLLLNSGNNGVLSTSGRENQTHTKINDPNGLHIGRIQTASSSAKPPQIHSEHLRPSSHVSRNIDQPRLSNLVSSNISTPVGPTRQTDLQKVGPMKQTDLQKLGSTKQTGTQKVRPTRSEKKMIKKHAKYEKLIGNWLPPVLQANLPDAGDDEDWLSKGKTVKSSMCTGEVETCRESVAPWQPCARFLAEVDIHALPYTVPF